MAKGRKGGEGTIRIWRTCLGLEKLEELKVMEELAELEELKKLG